MAAPTPALTPAGPGLRDQSTAGRGRPAARLAALVSCLLALLGTSGHFLVVGAEGNALDHDGHRPYRTAGIPDKTVLGLVSAFQWGSWGDFSSCSRSCGVGIRQRHRACYVTRPRFLQIKENRLCGEVETEHRTCNTQPCYSTAEDNFREQQCSAYNLRPYQGNVFRWMPYSFKNKAGLQQTKHLNPCALICVAADHSPFTFAVKLADSVVDGTSCEFEGGQGGVCVDGKCLPVGCDKELFSLKALDKCGVCGGNNATCRLVADDIVKNVHLGYNDIITIPENARHIQVVDKLGNPSVFALRNGSGIYFVNGRHSTSYPTMYSNVAGTTFYYHHPLYERRGQERIQAEGPTSETLYVMVLCPENASTIHISYEYTIKSTPRKEANTDADRIRTNISHEAAPDVTVQPVFIPDEDSHENGISYRGYMGPVSNSEYTYETEEKVDPAAGENASRAIDSNETFEPKTDQDTSYPGGAGIGVGEIKYHKPKKKKNNYKFYWRINQFASCSSTCTKGVLASYSRCYRSDKTAVDDKFCDSDQRPEPSNVICDGRPCPPRWVASSWSKCSVSCGDGRQFRSVRCWRTLAVGFDSSVAEYLCPADDSPVAVRGCRQIPCGPLWETSQWSECSAKCGMGLERRFVRCAGRGEPCDPLTKPRSVRHCNEGACVHKWVVSQWSKCSGPCGSGVRRRSVTCRDKNSTLLHDKFCDQNRRPLTVEPCGDTPDCPPVWTSQEWGICSALCGEGITTRQVLCGAAKQGEFVRMPDTACRHLFRPNPRTRCKEAPCPAKWFMTEWSQCSKSCGPGGVRIRKVSCYRDDAPSFGCDYSHVPPETEMCELPACDEASQPKECSDDPATNCALVVQVQLCDHRHYRKACCHTCTHGLATAQTSPATEEQTSTSPVTPEAETKAPP